MAWRIKIVYKDGGQLTLTNGKKDCPIDHYRERFLYDPSRIESAVLQYYPKKDNEPINLLEVH